MIPLIFQIPNGKRDHISVFGTGYRTKDGTCVRNYIHLAQAHILAVKYLISVMIVLFLILEMVLAFL